MERMPRQIEPKMHSTDFVVDTSQLSIEKAEKYRRYIQLLVEVGGGVKGLELVGVSESFKFGLSVYGYFEYQQPDNETRLSFKIRLSDHVGRWSTTNVDIRNPKNVEQILVPLKNLIRQQARTQ